MLPLPTQILCQIGLPTEAPPVRVQSNFTSIVLFLAIDLACNNALCMIFGFIVSPMRMVTALTIIFPPFFLLGKYMDSEGNI